MHKKTLLILATLCFFVPHSSYAKPVTLSYVEFPPYEFEKNGKPDGALVNIVKTVFEKAGIPLTLVKRPFKRAYEEVKSGQIDGLFNFYRTQERLEFFDYSTPVIKNPLVFFVKKDSSMTYEKLEDLKGLKIGTMTGYTYGTDFDTSPLFKRDPANSHGSNFKKLAGKRIDSYPCDKLVGIHVATENNLMSEFKILPTPLKIMNGYIGFTKGAHSATIKKINKTIEEMTAKGEIKRITDDFMKSNFQAPI